MSTAGPPAGLTPGSVPATRPGNDRTTRRLHTRQQRIVLEALHDSDRFRSATQIYRELRAPSGAERQPDPATTLPRRRTGLSTVYRVLHSLAADHLIDAQRAENGETLYRRCHLSGHHHYLLCRHCGDAVEVVCIHVEAWADDLARGHGSTDLRHHLDLYGTCPQCRDIPAHPT